LEQQEKEYEIDVERLLFAMVANRALDPRSKHAIERWVGRRCHVEGLEEVKVHQLYRAMDFLVEHDEAIRDELETLHRVELFGPSGHLEILTETTPAQRNILKSLDIASPPRIQTITTTPQDLETPRQSDTLRNQLTSGHLRHPRDSRCRRPAEPGRTIGPAGEVERISGESASRERLGDPVWRVYEWGRSGSFAEGG